jgi:hypothetical protein
MPVSQQIEYFKGCAYVRDIHRVFTPDGMLLKTEQFNACYGGYLFVMDSINDKTSKSAWEVFTQSQAYNFPKVHTTCFRPEREPGEIIHEEGWQLVNTYVPTETERQKGDPTPFLEHMDKLFPDDNDRAIIMAYMAACVQFKGSKFQWAPVIQGVEGNGKTLIISVVNFAVGSRYTHLPNAIDLAGNGHKFNAWVQGNLFIGVEEICVSDKREILEILKPLVTNSRLEIQGKGDNQITGDNRSNWIMCTNPKDALIITADSRRYCILYSAQQSNEDIVRDGMGGDYFPVIYDWLRGGGYEIINDYLHTYSIPVELNPALDRGGRCHRAPHTSSTHEAIGLSRGSVEQEILEAMDEGRPGFAGGWVSSMMLDKLLQDRNDHKRINHNRRRDILNELGYMWHPSLSEGRVNSVIMQEGGKPRLYVKRGHIAQNIKGPAEVVRHYSEAQGYITASDATAVQVFGGVQ